MTKAQERRFNELAKTATQFMSVSDVSEALKVTRQGVLKRINENRLPATMVGTQYLIPRFIVEREMRAA